MLVAKNSSNVEMAQNPSLAAKAAGLRYVSDESPGYSRKKKSSDFVFLDLKGRPIKDEHILKRIRSLVLPPAWTGVWICPIENGHLQATGRDAKGRKQYRYHPQWNQFRNENKFSKMLVFAEKLPKIRQRIDKDLQQKGMGREKVLAAIVRIMEQTMIRIGNEEYAKQNESYGLTTIRNQHVQIKGSKVRFRFKGKSGKFHDIEIEEKSLAQIVRKCQDLPGQDLFAYESEDGTVVDVTSEDVNNYLKGITDEPITAKDFRTWGGTVQAALTLQTLGPSLNAKQLKKSILQAVERTADHLRNTPSVCRRFYIHPCVLEAYETGDLFKVHAKCQKNNKVKVKGLYSEELFALEILKKSQLKLKDAKTNPRKSSSR